MMPNLLPARRFRKLVLAAILVITLTLVLLLSGSVGRSTAQPVTLTLPEAHHGKRFKLGAVGLSLEMNKLSTHTLSVDRESLVTLLRLLGPGVLRLGGNSLDYSFWTSSDEPRPSWAGSVITPADLAMLRELLDATDWRVILGVDLGHFEPTRAADEALIAKHTLGSRLLGFEIGNEPNGYNLPSSDLRRRTYNVKNYLREIAIYSVAMRAQVPHFRLYGPDLGFTSLDEWLPAITALKPQPFAALTQHFYPLTYSVASAVCEGTPVPTARELLSPEVRDQEDGALETIVTAGKLAHRETILSETNNTSSCDVSGGPATSPVFASALWSLDWTLRSLSAGVSGIYFHAGEFAYCQTATFSPICAEGKAAHARGRVTARPEFYGLLAARQLEGGRFRPVGVADDGDEDDFTAYATAHSAGVLTLAIDNFAPTRLTAFLDMPDYKAATTELLIGPSLGATHGVTFASSSLNVDRPIRLRSRRVRKVPGGFQLTLAPTSAAIVTLRR